MNKIRRIYVEKKAHANTASIGFFSDIRDNLGITSLDSARVINCYDVTGISDEEYKKCIGSVFCEASVDIYYEEDLPLGTDERAFGVQAMSGQYDQRADWSRMTIGMVLGRGVEDIIVKTSKFYVLKGSITDAEFDKVRLYTINTVDTMEIDTTKPETLESTYVTPEDVKSVEGFINMSEVELVDICAKLGLAMNSADILHTHNYFKNTEKRDPTITEIRVLDTYWSDHCRHTTFLTDITKIEIESGKFSVPVEISYKQYLALREEVHAGRTDKPLSLMDIAQMGMRYLKKTGELQGIYESEEVNACMIRVTARVNGADEKWIVMFKNETHNHPTEIEPFGGAHTCLGGAIRDPLSGRAYVYQAMRVTGSGDPRTPIEDTIKGKLPQRKITQVASVGYSTFGNQVGAAAGHVHELYDEGYVAKRMELGALVAAVKESDVIKERPEKGDMVILLGGKTGRDGIGGAVSSSKTQTDETLAVASAEVQKGDAPLKRKIQRLFRNPDATKLIKRCNDFGAGGVCVAIGELAEGIEVDLDKVPAKYPGLDGTELATSESQERMAVCVASKDADEFIRLAMTENLDAVHVATVTDKRRFVINWRGKSIVNISRDFLDTNGAKQYADVYVEAPKAFVERKVKGGSLEEKWLNNLADINVCAKKGLIDKFDSTAGASTLLMPLGGRFQFSPALAMAAKLPVLNGDTDTATLMSFGFDHTISRWSPYHGAMYAVVDSVAKIVASGGNPSEIKLSFQEYFERLKSNPVKWGKPFASLLGALSAQLEFGIASIGGKDSMSGTYEDIDVPPTLVSFAVSHTTVDTIISPEFKKADSSIVAIFCEYDESGVPNIAKLRELNGLVYDNIKNGNIISAHTIGFGGIAESLSKMAFGNRIGFDVEVDEARLFAANYGGYIFEIDAGEAEFGYIFENFDVVHLGNTTESIDFIVNGKQIKHFDALTGWLSPLEGVFNTNLLLDVPFEDNTLKVLADAPKTYPKLGIVKPKVLIPVIAGTNGEYDLARAFESAGADTEIFVLPGITPEQMSQNLKTLADKVKGSQILALPGNFGACGESDGSGKLITAALKDAHVAEGIQHLLSVNNGLMIGMGGGFHTLVRLGLLPFGEFRELDENSPTLTFNKIGRHISTIANTKIISNKSPWLWNTKPDEMYNVAISTGEGRFIASDADINKMIENGQIAAQYVDFSGLGANCFEFNPSGSMYAIEAITSPDGRILGKIGHTERYTDNCFKNISGNFDPRIFFAGVKYFA